MTPSLDDVAEQHVDMEDAAWAKRLDFRIKQLYRIGQDRKLTPWEENFCADMEQKRQNGSLAGLSDKQKTIILKTYHKYLEMGFVKIPEGMI